ncbi:alpha/beta hydrolase family protein [Mycolicibacterium helvum]|uniref:Dipeptidyl aminopeptidase n=1 Tax=Mycolicibacterium helvum TaxID=1534349 RepID=A0A7I7TC90_9MYCO|nr:alpha/beta hydrolase [Mycolicibacterium helvum]BBY66844.1 dipeptidyl aminopeptidase [Mycolicibacterium helvum]
MRLNFGIQAMDIGSESFNLVRTMSVAATGGAETAECLFVADRIKTGDTESWVREWAALAVQLHQSAEAADHPVTARQAYLRASNYYRTAMFSLPASDSRLDSYLRWSRACFERAATLFDPPIEVLTIPFEGAALPGYFLTTGVRAPTLIVLNGGDSTNEEVVHWLGFAAVARGWNCVVFEGPGQWSALQLNPGRYLRPDFEAPVRAVIDHVIDRVDVDPERLAIFGPSLGASLAVRATAYDERIKACIADGLVVDVYQAWHAVWPQPLRKAPVALFDLAFHVMERASPQLRGLTNRFRSMFGQTRPHELIASWRPFAIGDLAGSINVPMLLLYGEAELTQTDQDVAAAALRFAADLTGPTTLRVFGFDLGWAAAHCQVGALTVLHSTVFDWLDRVVVAGETLPSIDADLSVLRRHLRGEEAQLAMDRIEAKATLAHHG